MRLQPPVNMARPFILLVVVTALFPAATAGQQIGGGVKGGVSRGGVVPESPGSAARVGFVAGGFVTVDLGGRFAIQPEVLYTQKGEKSYYTRGATTFTTKTDYVDVPVLARFTVSKRAGAYLLAGPSFDFNVRSTFSQVTDSGYSRDDDYPVDSFEFAAVFGGGAELGRMLIEARWSAGLTPQHSGLFATKTSTFLILGGVRF